MQSILVLKLMTHTNAYTAYKQPGFITKVFFNMFMMLLTYYVLFLEEVILVAASNIIF